jgi:predicted permease
MNTLLGDLRFGLRSLRKSPGFAAVAVLTLALGIGANAALFSVVNGVLLNPLPYPHAEQLVTLHESKPNFDTGSISYPNFKDWRDQNQSFSGTAIYRPEAVVLSGSGGPEILNGMYVSSDFFPVLGVQPVAGRNFRAAEDEIGAAPTAMIDEGLWEKKFGRRPDILGETITLDGRDYVVVGIVPKTFNLFFTTSNHRLTYIPIGNWQNDALPNRNAGLGIHGVARLKPGVTLEQAKADMARVSANLAAAYPDVDRGIGASVIPLRQWALGRVQPYLIALLASVGFVLLIACVNVANLLLTRAAGRSREFAIRAAMGASQWRIVRQLVTEGVLLAGSGAGLGILLAMGLLRLALERIPFSVPRASEAGFDAHALLFTIGISILAGVFFGLTPALKTARPNLQETLKECGRGASGSQHRAHGVFVVVEMAMALVLLAGAGLMIRSLAALWNENPGFDPRNVSTFDVSMLGMVNPNPDAARAALREIDTRIASTPGVVAEALIWDAVPMVSDNEILFYLDGQARPKNPNDANWALNYRVEPDYLKTMRISLLQGRFFTDADNQHAPLVVVIDDVLAHQYFGNENPVGKRLNLYDDEKQAEIVGVVGHVNQWGLAADATELRAQMYLPFAQLSDQAIATAPAGTTVIVRTAGAQSIVFDTLRRTLQNAPGRPAIFGNQSMESIIAKSIANQRFSVALLVIFGALALVLASVGIYGVVSHLVGQRTHEIGVRIALGAQKRDVLRLILGRGFYLALIGTAVGLIASIALTRFLASQSLLYSVSATDPITFCVAAIVLISVAIAACYIPARRATKVDPIIALRYE